MTASLTLYTRSGCHLCETMHAEIGPLCETHRLGLRIVDVDSDPELSERFNAKVPVLALGDEIICCHFLDISALEDALSERADEQLNP